ncbi:MAG: phosphotransferase [Anaerolineae bacterium]|nr:phosphotransferase [Anaerolineae bacterium]
MRHYYIGVEHLFIALLDIRGGLTRSLLEEQGLTPDYVSDAIRRKIGKGSQRRLWAGTPSTPRANVVLDIANDLALEDGRTDVNERDLLTAVIEEDESMPVRTLKALGVDTAQMHRMARTRALDRSIQQPYISVDFAPGFDQSALLTDEHLLILRRMFYGHARIRVERQLTGGFTRALVLVVTPIHTDGREDAAVVVKIDDTDHILDEAQRYETHVKGILPPLTARLEDRPVAPEISNLAGLYYTLVSKPGFPPQDLRAAALEMGIDRVGTWLRQQLYDQFGRTWWQQRRPFRFQVWTEYDWLLPPIFTLQHIEDEDIQPTDHVLRVPVNRARMDKIEHGDTVVLENFTVLRVYPERGIIQLATGRGNEATRRAYRVEINQIDLGAALHYRGEVIERIAGRVWKTRQETLTNAADILEPPFDLRAAQFYLDGPQPRTLPNPLLHYEDLLYYQANGSTSKIHGDLHLGNILVGPNDTAFLIDFEHARDGHTLFDWATLEISLLNELVVPMVGSEWSDIYRIVAAVAALNNQSALPEDDLEIAQAYAPVIAVREIVHESLARADHWEEYYIAVALSALRAMCWETLSIGGRRLMLLVAALAIRELQDHSPGTGSSTTTPDDPTELPSS